MQRHSVTHLLNIKLTNDLLEHLNAWLCPSVQCHLLQLDLSVIKSPSDHLMKEFLESYRITCFVYMAVAVKTLITEVSLQALRSWCLWPLGRDFPTEAAAELHKGKCPVHNLGSNRQYHSWAYKISCSVSPQAGLGEGRLNFLHS